MERRANNKQLHIITYSPQDVHEAVRQLETIRESGNMLGLMFAVKVRGNNKPLFGLTGCCQQDKLAAIGAATHLLHAVTSLYMNE